MDVGIVNRYNDVSWMVWVFIFFWDDIDDFTKNYEDGSSKSELLTMIYFL